MGVVYTPVFVSARAHVRLYETRSIRYTASSGLVVIGARAAGVSWTLVTPSALWAARASHTSVIDADGNIYVLGGTGNGNTYYRDVWRSTDKGDVLHCCAARAHAHTHTHTHAHTRTHTHIYTCMCTCVHKAHAWAWCTHMSM
jgi:hypothetical protein